MKSRAGIARCRKQKTSDTYKEYVNDVDCGDINILCGRTLILPKQHTGTFQFWRSKEYDESVGHMEPP
jgi:hypothetical protein